MNLLDRKSLLKKQDLEIKKVDLGEDEFVHIRQMTGRERDRFEQSLVKMIKNAKGVQESKPSLDDFRAKLVVCCVCDENGDLLLHPTDIEALSTGMSAARLEKLVNVAQKLNNISEDDKEAMSKNSEVAQSDNSTSDSAKS